jgi:hypothetical protein
LRSPCLDVHVDIIQGVCADKSQQLLQRFFQSLRQK